MMELPVIDLEEYLLARGGLEENGDAGQEFLALCQEVANCLRDTGALVIRDPRCTTEDNDRFLDMMEKYWSQSDAFKRQQERPDVFYQVKMKLLFLECLPLSHRS